MEVRPIDANALGNYEIEISKDIVKRNPDIKEIFAIFGAAIDRQPTLDYEPVVHAHWERHYTFTDGHNKKHYWGYHCSSCGKGWIEAQPEKHYRCYYCGAKMDEEVK